SAIAIASVVVESIPPLKRTTAGFILVDCHPERSKAESKDPAEIPSVSQRDLILTSRSLSLAAFPSKSRLPSGSILDFAGNDNIIPSRGRLSCQDTLRAQ